MSPQVRTAFGWFCRTDTCKIENSCMIEKMLSLLIEGIVLNLFGWAHMMLKDY